MPRTTRIVAVAALAAVAAHGSAANAQPAVTLDNGRMTFPLEIDSSYYRVTLEQVRRQRNVYELDLADVWSIDAPDEDTASFTADDGILHVPSLWDGRSLLTDVSFERIHPHRFVFRLKRFRRHPEVIFFNGEILTMEARRPQVQALAVSGDTIVAMGGNRRVLSMRGRRTKLVNLRGKTLMPGFVDPHNHSYHSVFHGDTSQWATYADVEQSLLEAGTTTMGDANVWPDLLQSYLDFDESAGFRIRTSLYLGYNDFCGEFPWPEDWWKAHGPIKDPRAMLRIPGIKVFADGGACNIGAFVFLQENGDLYFTDKEKEPWPDDVIGWLPEDAIAEAAAGIEAAIREATDAGFQTAIHSLGDIAIDAVLLAIGNSLDGGPNTPRIRMEHNRLVRPDQWPKYGEVGAIPVVFGQPWTCTITDNGPWAFLNNATVLQPWFDPWRSLIDANPGLRIAWKSDAVNSFPYPPLTHLWSLVTRDEHGSSHNIPPPYVPPPPDFVCEAPDWLEVNAVTVDEALEMMTINAAHALFMERKVGSLRPGKFADVIVLSDNPRTVDPDEIVDIDVLMTMVGGKVEHCAAGYEGVCP